MRRKHISIDRAGSGTVVILLEPHPNGLNTVIHDSWAMNIDAHPGRPMAAAMVYEIEFLKRAVTRIDELHYPDPDYSPEVCVECHDWWPCATHNAAHPEELWPND